MYSKIFLRYTVYETKRLTRNANRWVIVSDLIGLGLGLSALYTAILNHSQE